MEIEWTAKKVRQTFIDFFVNEHQHINVPSSSVVPYKDKTLLFANAGMNQFKSIFLGQVDPKSIQATWRRAVNSQKCIRAGGKHNDLDTVGKDSYHHTFFEMLGNWSFGDYFKEEAITWAWKLLTEVYKLDKSRLYVTYFQGDELTGLGPDDEAKKIWERYLPAERVLPFGKKENFWEMGETGPCGPCSEIHFDRIGGRDATNLVNADDPTVIEIWNNVFIQFNREKDQSLTKLPAKHVDTGMGFERLLSILQNVQSNYDSDLWAPLMKKIQEITGAPAYSGKFGDDDKNFIDKAYRVLADHIRTVTVAINDGAAPGATGRNHVIRTILRRAVRYGIEILQADDSGFFYKLVPTVIEILGDAFPELKRDPEAIQRVILQEEQTFAKTLAQGNRKLNKIISSLKPGGVVSGSDAFTLYDRYGFPVGLTLAISEERGFGVDESGFEKKMDERRKLSEQSGKKTQAPIVLDAASIDTLKKRGVTRTIDTPKFTGHIPVESKVLAIIVEDKTSGKLDLVFKDEAQPNTRNGFVLETTNFYAESGGQVADTGSITGFGQDMIVEDVQVYNGYVVHMGQVSASNEEGEKLKVGDTVTCTIDGDRRQMIMANHTGTHLLNLALRETLGGGIDQRGSIVLPEKLRFDFSYTKPLLKEELKKIDTLVADMIKQDLRVYSKEVTQVEALQFNGIRAVFGETYPDPVRVVSIGASIEQMQADPKNPKWREYSVELCGGTHLNSSKETVTFVVAEEEASASSVRRIVALTGEKAREALENEEEVMKRLEEVKNSKQLEADLAVFKKELESRVVPARTRLAVNEEMGKIQDLIRKKVSGKEQQLKELSKLYAENLEKTLGEKKGQFHVGVLDGAEGSSQALTNTIKLIQEKNSGMAVMLLSADTTSKKKKLSMVCIVPESLVKKGFAADKWAKETAAHVGGKGGGKPGNAQASSDNVDKIQDARKFAEEYASKLNLS